MDEILIEEKKYISSKQAAKITGYAKDYIGQLCREGRVPARLVGRAWYVLESALQDHRFGVEGNEVRSDEKDISLLKSSTPPQYLSAEEVSITPLPTLNRLRAIRTPEEVQIQQIEPISVESKPLLSAEPKTELEPSTTSLQDSWESLFSAQKYIAQPPFVEEMEEKKPEEVIEVPIHILNEDPSREFLPHADRNSVPVLPLTTQKDVAPRMSSNRHAPVSPITRVFLVLIALFSISIAGINSGYFDKYFISHTQVNKITGIIIYVR